MEVKYLKALGLEKSNQSDIVGIFSNFQTSHGNSDYSAFTARLNKLPYTDYCGNPMVTGTGKDPLGNFNLTEYDYGHHWIKEYHPNSHVGASKTSLIYRYILIPIPTEIFTGKWDYSNKSQLPLIDISTRSGFESYGQFCFVTMPKKINNFNLPIIRSTIDKHLEAFNDALRNHSPLLKPIKFERITFDKINF